MQTDNMETPEQFVQRAVDFATKAHEGQLRKYTGEAYIVHPMSVAFLVARVNLDPKVIAAAWLHDTVEDTKATLDEIAQQFGFLVAGMVRTLSDLQTLHDGNRSLRKKKHADQLAAADADVQTIKTADLIDNSISILLHDWNFARVYIPEMEHLIEVMDKAHPFLRSMAQDSIKNSKSYLKDVVGDYPQTGKKISTGHPSCLGTYKMLATKVFGSNSPAVDYLTKKISMSSHGVGEPVLADESQMLSMLTNLHNGTEGSITVQ